MADPLSILSLVIELTPKVIRYVLDIKEGPEERRQLVAEISSASGILSVLQKLQGGPQVGGEWKIVLASLGNSEGPLQSYANLLGSIQAALRPRNGLRQIERNLTWPFRRKDVQGYLARIERYKSLFSLAVQLDNKELTSKIQSGLEELKHGQEVLIRTAEHIHEAQQDETFRKTLEWISPVDHSKKHRATTLLRTTGTGTWILDNKIFQDWELGDLCTLLCYGIPGAGKTVLASSIVDHLIAEHISGKGVGIAYLYCDYKEKSSQSFKDLLPAILKQLMRFAPHEFIQKVNLLHHLKSYEERTSLSDVSQLLRDLVDQIGKIYIIIDALDEIEEADGTRDSLMTSLMDLQAINIEVHVLVTSRPKQTAIEYFPEAALLELIPNELDLRTYVEGRTETEWKLQKQIKRSPAIKQTIIDTILANCQGMFLLARLHVDWITRARTLADLEESLQKLPSGQNGLSEIYGEAMERIQSQDDRGVDLANRILAWLCFSFRPLKADELRWALAVDPLNDGEKDFNEKRLVSREDITLLCAGLVTINTENDEVRLVHFTTQEFFISQREKLFPDARLVLASTCIKFLSYTRFRKPRCDSKDAIEELKSSNPFLEYAVTKLGDHVRPVEAQVKSVLVSLMRRHETLDCINQVRKGLLGSTKDKLLLGRLETAIQYGLRYVVADLLSHALNDVEEFYKTCPIHTAIAEGQFEITEMLIQSGADLHARNEVWNTALHAVAVRVHENRFHARDGTIAKLILEKAPEILDYANRYQKTALHDAAERNNIDVMKILLDCGASIDAKDNAGHTPLWFAVKNGQHAAVKLLLDSGANLRLDDHGSSPLAICASKLRSTECLSLLLAQPSFNYTSQNATNEVTALHVAVSTGNRPVAHLILAHDKLHGNQLLNRRNHLGKTALHDTCERGHLDIVRTLLAHGADPSIADVDNRTVLHYAAGNGHTSVLEELLRIGSVKKLINEKATSTGTIGWPIGTALHTAVKFVRVDAANKLIRSGADMTRIVDDSNHRTAKQMMETAGWKPVK